MSYPGVFSPWIEQVRAGTGSRLAAGTVFVLQPAADLTANHVPGEPDQPYGWPMHTPVVNRDLILLVTQTMAANRSGVSTRRSACDDCRFSKSKCLRQRPDQARCDRCLRSESECIISPIFRLRNWEPLDHESSDTPNKKKRPRQSGGEVRTPSINNASTTALFEGSESSLLHLQLHDSPTPSLNLSLGHGQQGTQIPSSEQGETMAGDWLRHWVPISPQQAFSVTGAPPYETSVEDMMGSNQPLSFQLGAESGSGFGANPSSFFSTALNTSAPNPTPSSIDIRNSQPPYGSTSMTEHNERGADWQINSRNAHDSCASGNLPQHCDSLPQVEAPTQQQGQATSPSEHLLSVGQTPLQCLCRLDHDLVTMLARLEHETATLTMKRLVTVQAGAASQSVAHQILDKTTEFVRILEILVDISRPLNSSNVNTPSSTSSIDTTKKTPKTSLYNSKSMRHGRRRGPSPFSISDDDDGNNEGEDDSDSISSTRRSRYHRASASAHAYTTSAESTCSPTSSPSVVPTPPDLDVASLLSILITYMRLVQLYLIVFAYVNSHLKDLSQSDSPHLGPIAGLAFSSFPMQSGNLQTLILIQIVTNLFEKIDDLLAMPKEFRMSGRRRQGALLIKSGILAQAPPGFLELARGILAPEGRGRGRGGGK
ncbi:hypothetical protein V8F33_006292 [Rhypophila sp. PSN 637]